MRNILAILFILPIALTSSCSSATEKDSLLHEQLSQIITENELWLSELQDFDSTSTDSQEELRRKYFSNQATSSSTYSTISLVVKYFDIQRSLIEKYRKLLDQRDKKVTALHRCQDLSLTTIEELIPLEQSIIKILKKIESSISD